VLAYAKKKKTGFCVRLRGERERGREREVENRNQKKYLPAIAAAYSLLTHPAANNLYCPLLLLKEKI
jgi:hypothetical protein